MLVCSVIRKVFPVALAEIGLGMTRSKAILASGDVGLESLHAANINVRTMNVAQLKYPRAKCEKCIGKCFRKSNVKKISLCPPPFVKICTHTFLHTDRERIHETNARSNAHTNAHTPL